MRTLLSLTCCIFVVTTGEFVVAGLLPVLAGDLDVSVGMAGQTVTAYALGMVVGGPVLTTLTAQVDRKRLMLALLGFALLGNLASAMAPGLVALLAFRTMTALVTSTFFASAIVVAAAAGPPDHAGRTVSRLALGMNVAMLVGAPAGTAIGARWGWRVTFVALAVGCLLGLVLVARLVPATRDERPSSARGELRTLVRRTVVLALATTAVGSVGALMVFSYLAPLLTRVSGHPVSRMPLLIVLYGVGATVGNIAGGVLFDRTPGRSLPVALTVLVAVLAATWAVAGSPAWSLAAVVGLGAASFAVVPAMQARVLAAARSAPTLAMAVNASGYQAAVAAAGLLGGVVADSRFGPHPICLVAAIITLAGLGLSLVPGRSSMPHEGPDRPARAASRPGAAAARAGTSRVT